MSTSLLPPLKQYQLAGLQKIKAIRESKERSRIVAVSPPGSGKSRVMTELSLDEINKPNGLTMINVHRAMLLEQLIDNFNAINAPFGVIAAGYKSDLSKPIQICSTHTLFARGVQRASIDLPKPTLVLNDEAHLQTGSMMRALVYGSFDVGGLSTTGWINQGADVIGFTATPVMGAAMYDQLIELANYSDLRQCNMHQLIRVFSPDEIDTAGLKQKRDGEFSESGLESRAEWIFGSAFDEYKKLNPMGLPTLLYAPSVKSSKWFARQFLNRGVRAAHIDGEMILMPEGDKLVPYPAEREYRQDLLAASKSGDVQIICNRFVLREAIDMPWVYHAILATVVGSLSSYLQIVGRLQRFCADYPNKILQCHGGSFWRHGSPNDDRTWRLGCTLESIQRERVEKLQNGQAMEGIRCPKCGYWRYSGSVCPNSKCRYVHSQSVRAVRTMSGRLKAIQGKVYTKPPEKDIAQQLWVSTLFRMSSRNATVSQAVAVFMQDAAKQGLTGFKLSDFRNPPPTEKEAAWDLPIRVVYPWTVRKQKKAKANEQTQETQPAATSEST